MTLSRFIYLLLIIIAGYAAFYLYQQSWLPKIDHIDSTELPLFTGKNVSSTKYSVDGLRDYYMTSESFEHFADTGDTKFHEPQVTVYKMGNTVEWVINADLAVLNKQNQLLLTGNVKAQNHVPNSDFDSMTTESMTINLNNKDFFSDKTVLLNGPTFSNQGNSVKGNFNDNITTLSNQVQGTYNSVHQ